MKAELKQVYDCIYDMEEYLLSLIREKSIIQNIELEKPDFADLQVSHELLTRHIEYIRRQLKNSKTAETSRILSDYAYEEEEEEESLTLSKYTIEHVIENEDGTLREPAENDFYIDRHPGVKKAFMVFQRWRKYRAESEEGREYK